MDGVQDFNSSDVEFDDDPSPELNERLYGQESIDRMIADAQKDRISSKKTVKQLRFQGVAPKSQSYQSLWTRRFEAFRQHVLQQSPDVPFTGTDMIRFFDSIIGKIKPCGTNKPAPNLNVIQSAFKVLLKYGTFRWSDKDGFGMTPHDGARFKAFTIQAVKEKRLIKGTWRKRTWIGFVTLSRMIRVFLEHFIQNGAWNFDVVISKCLSVVLIASLGGRSGDVARSDGYSGVEHMKYKDIELYLEAEAGEQPQFRHLRATVTIEYAKGDKDTINENHVRYFRPLDDVQSIHVCPIALLLVHALRNGLVHGTTLEEVLSHTAGRPDLHVEWKHPERPILTAIARKPSRCDLDVVTSPHQVLNTIKQMGLISGMLSRVYAHSLRLGAIRDYTHLTKPVSDIGVSSDDIRRFAGHTHTSMVKGVTERYSGDLARDHYNDRAENGGVNHRREPKFALDARARLEMVKRPISAEEIQADLNEHRTGQESVSVTKMEKKTVQTRIRRKRVETSASSAMAEPVARRTTSNAALHSAPAPPKVPEWDLPMRNVKPATKKSQVGRSELSKTNQEDSVAGSSSSSSLSSSAASAQQSESSGTRTSTSEDLVFLSMVDPALLDEETLASLEVTSADVNALQAAILPNVPQADTVDADQEEAAEDEDDDAQADFQGIASDAAIEGNMEEAARMLLGQEVQDHANSPASTPLSTASNPEEWINGFARYNVVANTQFANAWKKFADGKASFEESVGHHSARGNSRDEPTPFMLHCRRTEGCDYRAIKLCLIEQHERSCNTSLVETASKETEAEVLKCTHTGCNYETSGGQKALKKHISRAHNWTPKACDDPQCDPETIYKTRPAWETHQTNVHSGRWPTKCLVPDCPETKEFGTRPTLIYHLKTRHNLLTGDECLPYLPPLPAKKQWVKQQKCVVSTCTSTKVMNNRYQMLTHLTSAVHKMSAKDAEELIDRDGRCEDVVPETKVLGPSGNAKKRNSQRAFAAAPGKENESYAPPAASDDVRQRDEHENASAPSKPKKPRAGK
ncbi:hypothetical protein diail_9029 [Diaporthe ilicicola]|nr:hypothetical protein diail_9029 [Diaporthe ilicicola]